MDEYGASIRYSGGRILVEKDCRELATVRAQDLEAVIVMENASITSAALIAFLRGGIDVAFLTGSGEYAGKLESVLSKNIGLRRQQYRVAEDESFCVALSKRFVAAKLANMRTIVMRYARSQANLSQDSAAITLKEAAQGAGSSDALNAILGYEGLGSREYFGALKNIIKPPFVFTDRNRRPPRDPVNAMLSFAYALLENYVERAVSVCGLDPYCGFLHRECYGRQGLVLDLMEELRPVIADSVVITACNRHYLKPDADFESRDGGVFLNESGRQKLFEHFVRRMRESVQSNSTDGELTYEKLCVCQSRMLADCIRRGVPDYRPFLVK